MPRITIDNQPVEVEAGATVLAAARRLGIDIPALCFLEGHPPQTSCMACLVKVDGGSRFLPACATVVREGMHVESETDEVGKARRTAIELLLGDHLGDCIAPCQAACPAHMDIPHMIRLVAAGRMREAVATAKERIPLPAVLGRICPAPCEKACRRGVKDSPVAVCLLKRFAGDAGLDCAQPPPATPATGRNVAVVGAGPAGLSAAFYLARDGHHCTLFDDHEKPGGTLRHAIPEERLPRAVIDVEASLILKMGVKFAPGTKVESVDELSEGFDAVVIATGRHEGGMDPAPDRPGVFVAGAAARPMKIAVSAVADGRAAAARGTQHLSGRPETGPGREFSVHVGRVDAGQIDDFLATASRAGRVDPSSGTLAGFTEEEARREARRCLHCDCRRKDDCKLRSYADLCGASASKHKGPARPFRQHRAGNVIYEPGKCIVCGLCVQIARRAAEPLGLAFVGRGFDVRVAVPFNRPFAEALQKAAAECVRACPTGALAFALEDKQ